MKKNIWKYVVAGTVAASLIPFKVKREENGDFDYRSLLLGVSKKTDEENGAANLSFSFFNLPRFNREDEVFADAGENGGETDEGVLIIEDAAEEAPAEAEEAPSEEAAEEPAEQAPACEPCEAAE